ncbi:MAG: alkaline phosphatase family protein [Terriglobales bacterium]
MKPPAGTLLALLISAATFAPAQTYNTPIRHVIVVMQENRTPDNLFQDPVLIANGADISSTGFYKDTHGQRVTIPLAPGQLDSCYDASHSHTAWLQMWDNGAMDGANRIKMNLSECIPSRTYPPNLQLTYVSNSQFDGVHGILDPYFQLAEQYGFANRMFQTNQGPSFPAHQFLFSGTSAPVPYNDPSGFWTWFSAENPLDTGNTGCTAPQGEVVLEIAPNGKESPGYNQGYPCYEHPAITDLLESATPPVTWRYYAHGTAGSMRGGQIWNAPNAINHICQSSGPGGYCQGLEWKSNVVIPSQQVLTDICNGNLASVTWVVPDGNWSDHAGTPSDDAGPSWVAALANYIGNSDNNGACVPENYWNDTVIVVVWDDWGGWFDHVAPWAIGYANNTGGQYVYGFRVPLLVVSAYTRQTQGVQGFTGYISSLNYDFGSILNFIEYVFGQSGNSLGQIGPLQYPYADTFAPDLLQGNAYSLSDFFDFSQSHPFKTIPGAKYPPSYFVNYQGSPHDPDNDADED